MLDFSPEAMQEKNRQDFRDVDKTMKELGGQEIHQINKYDNVGRLWRRKFH